MKIIFFNRKEFQEWKYFLKLLDHLLKKIKERWNEFMESLSDFIRFLNLYTC